jgi:16S rRNA (cytosine1402-N4)-methyltransferase
MRMNPDSDLTAADILNEYSEAELQRIFSQYGEVKNARTLAKAIAAARVGQPFETSKDLKAVAEKVAPRHKEYRYFAQIYQSLRIEVNQELEALKVMLEQSADVLLPEGRLVVLSYHSLEDRIVKNYILKGNVNGQEEKDFYGNPLRPFDAINRKPIEASDEEKTQNPRARSAKLRIAKRNEQSWPTKK